LTGPTRVGIRYKSSGKRAQALLRHPHADLHDTGIMPHPTLHRFGREPLLPLGGLSQKLLRHLRPDERRLTHPFDPGRADFRHGVDGNLGQGGDGPEIRN
jgi:hypothetical protein